MALPLIVPAVVLSQKRRQTVFQRLGRLGSAARLDPQGPLRPGQKPIWVHALSVGEVISAVPLVKAIRRRFASEALVFSVSTQAGYEIAKTLLPDSAQAVFFFPYDLIFCVRHVVRGIAPRMVIQVETDIWPNFLFEMKRQRVPVLLVNARLSDKSYRGYKRLLFFMKSVLSTFSVICAQTSRDAGRFQHLGVPADRITLTGNMKFDQETDLLSDDEQSALRRTLHIRPWQAVLLAGSTHKGEESIILDAFARIRRMDPRLILVFAPRDPARAHAVQRLSQAAGFTAFQLKQLADADPELSVDVIIVDVIGHLRKLYALADLAFIGGSLVNAGGHNPLEPAAYAKPVMFGPDMSNFRQISQMLLDSGGALRIQDAESLSKAASGLLQDEIAARNTGRKAFGVFLANKGAVQKTLHAVEGCYASH